jgi:fatty-acyl-CoA synthase
MAMMDVALDTWMLLDHAATYFGEVEIVSRLPGGDIHRETYREMAGRTQQLMHGLDALGVGLGERVGTLAWNGHRHFEAYFGIPCAGRVMHTLNLRLSPQELSFIVQDGGDRAILVDADLLPILEAVNEIGGLAGVEHVVVLGSDTCGTELPGAVAYEDLLAGQPTSYARPDIDERSPLGICHTSGTTGRPKGVVYTHRSTVIHAMVQATGAGLAIGPGDSICSLAPMFHANAWGMPYSGTLVGAKQVYLGGSFDPAAAVDMFVEEAVTVAAGVPTMLLALADELGRRGIQNPLPALRYVASGGSQPPLALIERLRQEFDIALLQMWGMTEMSPMGAAAWPKHAHRDLDEHELIPRVRTQAGIPAPGVTVTIRDEHGADVPWDGTTMGDLLVKGPAVIDSYLNGVSPDSFTDDGFLKTGDVAIGSPEGYFVIADRSKDLIKSGGEWISSVDLEAAIMDMPRVVEAAVVAVPDARWQERPLACVVMRPGEELALDDVREHLLAAGFAKWQLPDRLEQIDEVPRTSVGKFDKKALRERFT